MGDDTANVCTQPSLAGHLPAYLITYIDEATIERAALTYQLDPFTHAAILDRETNGGTSKDLDQPGPSGTGDFGKRNPLGKYGCALPPDGRGWGRGLFQIDYGTPGSENRIWCETKLPDGRFQWEDPWLNALKAAELFAGKLAVLGMDVYAAIGAYNAGEGNVQRVLRGLPSTASLIDRIAAIDKITSGPPSGGNYVSDVWRRRKGFNPPGE